MGILSLPMEAGGREWNWMLVSQPELEQIERLGGADLVVGILDTHQGDGAAAVATVREAVANLPGTTRAVVVCSNGTSSAPPIDAHAAGNGESPPVASFRLSPPNLTDSSRENLFDAYQAVFAVGGKLGARACVLTSSQPQVDLRMDLPAGPAGAGSGVRSGRAPLHPPQDGRSPQPERPRSAAPGALRRAASKSHGSGLRTLGEASAAGFGAGFRRTGAGNEERSRWHPLLPRLRAAVFGFANRIWARAPSRLPTG